MFAPAGTPRAIIERLHQASSAAVTTPDTQAKLATAGVDVETLSPQQLYTKLSTDLDRWGKVVKASGMKPN